MKTIDDCVGVLREAVDQRPRYPDLWCKLGLLLARMKRTEAALDAFDRALELNPQYVEAGISRSFLLAELGKVPEGFRFFRALHVRSPDDFDTVFALGIYCMRNGWTETGVSQLLRARSLRPTMPNLLIHAARARFETGDEHGARELIGQAREILGGLGVDSPVDPDWKDLPVMESPWIWENPYLVKVHLLMAGVLFQAGEAGGAERELRLANARFPGHPQLMVEMGRTLASREELREAMAWLSGAIVVDPCCHQAYYDLSFLHAQNDALPEALEALRNAVHLRPLFPDYRHHFGILLDDIGETSEAIEEFERVYQLNPSYGLNSIRLASVYLERGQSEKAIELLESGPYADWPEAMILSARANLKSGRTEAARCLLERALNIDGSNVEAKELLCALPG